MWRLRWLSKVLLRAPLTRAPPATVSSVSVSLVGMLPGHHLNVPMSFDLPTLSTCEEVPSELETETALSTYPSLPRALALDTEWELHAEFVQKRAAYLSELDLRCGGFRYGSTPRPLAFDAAAH